MTTSVSADEFRRWMGRWATGVAVVTAHDHGADAGLTVNALLSVSLTPPSVLVSLTHDADTTPLIEKSRAFAVNLLAADQRSLSERFARTLPSAEKFQGLPLHRGATGAPLLDGTLGALECQVAGWVPQYDHVLVIGEVVRTETGRDADPLVYYRSGYAEAEPRGRLRLPTAATQ
jgi:flavin reductase (DIM6/NTAB) family NADH-FMN oxidoreductase RutF